MTERNPEQGGAAETERPKSGSSEESQTVGTILPGIEHIVVLMFENRSFDNMLGGLYPQKSTNDYNGLQQKKCIPSCSDTDPSPVCTWSAPYGLDAMVMPYPDPGELFADMNEQIFGPGPIWAAETMKGFACNYIKQEESPDKIKPVAKNIMQYYQPGDQSNIPITTALAQAYAVCDQWFASGPVQTLANRIFAHCATPGKYQDANKVWHANINNTDITDRYTDPDGSIIEKPVFQLLDERAKKSGWLWPKRLPWKVYYHDWPLSAFIKYVDDHWDTFYGGKVYPFKDPWYEKDAADFFYDVEHDLPTYCFIEPRYTDSLGGVVNSNHPGGSTIDENPPAVSVCDGELLLQTVYTTLYNAPNNLFEKTLLIVIYDEHGGLYDHVAPLPATSPFAKGEVEGFDYNRYGVRVPAIFINPRISPQTITRSALEPPGFDHTSIISTLRQQFDLGGPLTPRDANATTLEGLINPQNPLNPFSPADLPTLSCPTPAPMKIEPGALRAEPRPHSVAYAIKKAMRSPKNQARVQHLKGPKP